MWISDRSNVCESQLWWFIYQNAHLSQKLHPKHQEIPALFLRTAWDLMGGQGRGQRSFCFTLFPWYMTEKRETSPEGWNKNTFSGKVFGLARSSDLFHGECCPYTGFVLSFSVCTLWTFLKSFASKTLIAFLTNPRWKTKLRLPGMKGAQKQEQQKPLADRSMIWVFPEYHWAPDEWMSI